MNIDRKHLKLFIVAMFFLGLALGIGAKLLHDAPVFSAENSIHLLLIFSSGLSVGGIITRIRYERKIEKMTQGSGSPEI